MLDPTIAVTASGLLKAGPRLLHLPINIENPAEVDKIASVGYNLGYTGTEAP